MPFTLRRSHFSRDSVELKRCDKRKTKTSLLIKGVCEHVVVSSSQTVVFIVSMWRRKCVVRTVTSLSTVAVGHILIFGVGRRDYWQMMKGTESVICTQCTLKQSQNYIQRASELQPLKGTVGQKNNSKKWEIFTFSTWESKCETNYFWSLSATLFCVWFSRSCRSHADRVLPVKLIWNSFTR